MFVLSGTLIFAGQVQLQPSDLKPGERYRLAFLTSTLTKATSSDISTYNEFVQATADSAPSVGQWGLKWMALASTLEVNARDNTGTNVQVDESLPIYLVDGTPLVPTYEALYHDAFPDDPDGLRRFNVNELGDVLIGNSHGEEGRFVWTGTDYFGAALVFSNDFENSRGPLGTPDGVVGNANDARGAWLDGEWSFDTNFEFPMYAISEVLTAVPEPSGHCLLSLAVVFLTMPVRASRSHVSSTPTKI